MFKWVNLYYFLKNCNGVVLSYLAIDQDTLRKDNDSGNDNLKTCSPLKRAVTVLMFIKSYRSDYHFASWEPSIYRQGNVAVLLIECWVIF